MIAGTDGIDEATANYSARGFESRVESAENPPKSGRGAGSYEIIAFERPIEKEGSLGDRANDSDTVHQLCPIQ